MLLCNYDDRSGSGYVGNVAANTRLNIPAIKMNDGPQGFRGTAGLSTAFSSGLNSAATFDPEMVQLWGQSMGKEVGTCIVVQKVPITKANFLISNF